LAAAWSPAIEDIPYPYMTTSSELTPEEGQLRGIARIAVGDNKSTNAMADPEICQDNIGLGVFFYTVTGSNRAAVISRNWV